jgi:hypothetical protein
VLEIQHKFTGAAMHIQGPIGRLASDFAEIFESVDVNPFLLKPDGGVALDALVVIRPLA